MNKLYCILWLLLTSLALPGRAQAPAGTLRQQLDHHFAHLDKSQVPTGLLAEYAHPLVPLAYFDGTLADSTRTNASLFRALYVTAASACLYGPNPLPSLPTFNQRVQAAEAASTSVIPVMVERLDYAGVRPDAFSLNLLSLQGGQVYDVPGRAQSPYQVRTLFAAAPTRGVARTGSVRLVLPQSLYVAYSVGSLVLLAREVDFGDGRGYLPAAWDQPLTATYATAGPKRIKVRFTYRRSKLSSAGTVAYESQFDLLVAAPAAPAAAPARPAGGSTMADDSVLFAAQPGRGAGKAYIHYAAGHTTLVKPLIIAEGYDKHFIAPHISPFNYSIDQFLTEIQTSPGFNLRNALENTGSYDIVFIDYANGTDDILLNAGLFKDVLDWVNTNKDPASTEQNVVMGMSMGGLIARYKLAEMEKNTPGSTHVRLLVLQDSPQRGANVPLGIQALARQCEYYFDSYLTGDIDATLNEAIALLEQPATKQLLLYQTAVQFHDGKTKIRFVPNTFLDGPYRSMVDYAAPYRIVAVSQGSQCGVGILAPHTELLRAEGIVNLFNLPFIFAGSSGLAGQVIVNALPAQGQSDRVSGVHLVEQTELYFGAITLTYNIVSDDFDSPTGLLPIDGAAGSTEPIGEAVGLSGGVLVGNTYRFTSPFWFPYMGSFSLAPKFTFLPTASALDLNDFNAPALNASFVKGVASVSYSRTNGFIAQERTGQGSGALYNQPHLTFTARNGEWMYNEMQRPFNGNTNPLNCTATSDCDPAANKVITGPLTLCTGSGGPATYTSPLQGPGYTYTWTASPASAFTVASGSGPTFQTANVPGVDALGTISLIVNTGCEFTFSKAIVVGAPLLPDVAQTDTPGGCTNYHAHFQINDFSPGLIYTVTPAPGYSRTGNPNTGLFGIKGSSRGGQFTSYTLTVTNACGTATDTYDVDFGDCTGPTPMYAVYPNPADDQLTVEQTDSTGTARTTAARGASATAASSSAAPSTPYTVRLFDSYGVQQAQQATTTPTLQLGTGSLPTGLYLLHIEVGGAVVERRRLQITH